MHRRSFLRLLGPTASLGLLAGCTGGDAAPEPNTQTTFPERTVEFPGGPKDPPAHPDTLTEDTAGEFVRTYERRYVYNQLWKSNESVVGVACELQRVENIDVGYKVIVSCEGQAKTGGSNDDSPVYSDYFNTARTYYIDDNTIIRNTTAEPRSNR